jgi:hypothetical protein
MNKITLSNNSNADVRVMIEPLADTFDIPVSSSADLLFTPSPIHKGLQIDIHDENCITIWIDGDIDVRIGETHLSFPNL